NAKAELLAKMGKVEEAIELFDRAFQVNPNDEVCLNAKAELLAKMGKFEEAIELFDRSYKVNPNDVVCLTAKGKLLTKMGKIEEAIELFDRAFQIDPTYPVTLSANASLLTKPGRIEEAIKKYRAAVESIGKHDPYFLCGLGFLLLKRNSGNHDINEAIDLFTRAEMYSGSEEISLLGLWVAHARLGNHDKSMHYKNLFHQKKAAPAGEETQIPQEPEEKQFNRVEDEITAENMADNTVYNRLISAILSYALSVMR
ncbi:MAG: tetratricopeptide repeat protein, partial [bacterium]|nr:tetratricopeptide repeat protein [bacterium]